jgi:MoxR-like ATPase
MFKDTEDTVNKLAGEKYLTSSEIATTVYLASVMEKPLLVEGPAGVGKTELGKAIASACGYPLIRLQCYEGLDEARSLYEWEYSKQLLYTQILREKLNAVIEGEKDIAGAVNRISREESAFFSEKFIVPRPLLRAISGPEKSLLLIDEIDKSDQEFEAFLLEVLSDFQVTIPEIGTFTADEKPFVLLTSNSAREMSDALKRRCLHLYIDYPSREVEEDIVLLKVPGCSRKLAEGVVKAVNSIRELTLKKAPSISETLDWAEALVIMGHDSLSREAASETLNIILKYRKDIGEVDKNLTSIIPG